MEQITYWTAARRRYDKEWIILWNEGYVKIQEV
jgi:hypothetical protein